MKPNRIRLLLLRAACWACAAGGVAFAAANAPAGMVIITGGVFRPLFGSPTDAREVPVPSFCLDALPVTNGDFLEFVRANSGWQRSRVMRLPRNLQGRI